jgi:hypothetical protein
MKFNLLLLSLRSLLYLFLTVLSSSSLLLLLLLVLVRLGSFLFFPVFSPTVWGNRQDTAAPVAARHEQPPPGRPLIIVIY